MIGSGKDWVVSLKAQRKFFDALSSAVKRIHIFPGAHHAIFHEYERREVVDLVREFALDCFAKPKTAPSFMNADKSGHTWNEYKRLKNNGSIGFGIARAGLRAAGRLSRGIEIGWRNGFDSGLSLDYIYKNEPRGATPLGRLIDKSYLNSIGWRGIRQRKANLEKALRRVIEKARENGCQVRILDIAAGPGRYVLEAVQKCPEVSMSVTLRDYKQENIDAARALAQEFGLADVNVQRGDAFDRASLE